MSSLEQRRFEKSDSGAIKYRFSWYNVLCGQFRAVVSSTLQRYKPRASSLQSISNPSLCTIEDSVEEVEELSPSQMFSWTKMKNIFTEFQMNYLMPGDALSLETIHIARNIFDNLLLDEERYCEAIYDSIMKLDKTYAERFFAHSQLPKIRTREHMTRHLKKIIELHRILLYAFEDDTSKALQLLNLLALSHVLMKISIVDFKVFDLAIGKFLYRMEMIDETTEHHVIGYLSTITTHVETLINRHSLVNRKRELLLSDTPDFLIDINSICRDNYRELKKWHQFQLILRKTIADREEEHTRETVSIKAPAHTESQLSNQSKRSRGSQDYDGWFIEFLKRGYKYKEYGKGDF